MEKAIPKRLCKTNNGVTNLSVVKLIWTSTVLASVIQCCDSAKILCIFPVASHSHQQAELAVSRALAKKGHDLTVITSDPSETPIKNHREIDISFMYEYVRGAKSGGPTTLTTQGRQKHSVNMLSEIVEFMEFYCDQLLSFEPVKQLIREINGTKFDLIIYELGPYLSLLGVSDLIGNPPTIAITVAAPAPFDYSAVPSYQPLPLFPFDDRMTFWQRAVNLVATVMLRFGVIFVFLPSQEKMMVKHFGHLNHRSWEIELNKSLVIVSADLGCLYPSPLQPNMVNVGYLHIKQELEPLPQDLKKWLDEAEDSVIYFSLGSNMQGTSVDTEKRAAFINAFSRFPKVRVVWKWESDKRLPGQPDNVLTKKWIPQQSLLAHPKVKLFISQCGYQSFQEAITNSIPILGVPMFGDQDFNAKKVVSSGVGLSVEYSTVTSDVLHEKITELLTNPRYKENMKKLQAIAKDKPMPPVETAVWWVEYVLRHQGAPHLRPAFLDLTWYQYFLLDVIGAFLLAFSIAGYIFYVIVKKIINCLCGRKQIKVKTG